jgi:DNA-binding MarR family transcriptional regulator
VAAFEALTRALVGVALQSLQPLPAAVSLPQVRLLLTLSGTGRVPSSRLAEAVGMSASSVTRLVDRLQAAGYLARGGDERNRSIVTVEITAAGQELVDTVLEQRHAALSAVLDQMTPTSRRAATKAALEFARLAAGTMEAGSTGPIPL